WLKRSCSHAVRKLLPKAPLYLHSCNASPREALSRFRLNETDSQLEQEAMTSHPALVESHRGRLGCVDPPASLPTRPAWRSSCRSAPSHDRGSRRWLVGFRKEGTEP